MMEPELFYGSRGWPDTQNVTLTADTHVAARQVQASWYGTTVDENVGAFCMIREGSDLEYLVGEYVLVGYGTRSIAVFCVGGSSEIDTDFALARRAWLALEWLNQDDIRVSVEPMAS